MYHEVTESDAAFGRLAVSPADLERQLAYLAEAGFTPVTAGALAAAKRGGTVRLPDHPVVLTFDDGFADFYSTVFPLLAAFGFTATIFITAGMIGGPGGPPAVRPLGRMLTWTQLGELAAAGIEVGAHSYTHPQLDQLPAARIRHELRTSKAEIEDRLGDPVPGMAFPYGYFSRAVVAATEHAGYRYSCTVGNTMRGTHADPFRQPRLTVRRSTTIGQFSKMIEGKLTTALVQDRILTSIYKPIRRTRSAVSMLQEPT
jgi:peptidoglycan/xylan/chitin deacetylase (PgdA/CDA1 family)